MFSLKNSSPVWEQFGTQFSEKITTSEAILKSGADFEVGKTPLIVSINGENQTLQGLACTYRTDTNVPFGVVGENYGLVQNSEAFGFIDKITGTGNAVITAAGAIKDGRQIFVTAKFPEPYKIKGTSDIIEDYCVFTTSHDGTGAVICMLTPIRVVCQNTLNMALRGAKNSVNKLSFKHSRYVGERLEAMDEKHALDILNVHNTFKADFQTQMDTFASQTVSEDEAKKIIARTFMNDAQYKAFSQNNFSFVGVTGKGEEISTAVMNTINDVMDNVESGVGQENWRGSALWLLNGVTTYFANGNGSKEDSIKQFDSLTDANGLANKYTQRAYDELLVKVA